MRDPIFSELEDENKMTIDLILEIGQRGLTIIGADERPFTFNAHELLTELLSQGCGSFTSVENGIKLSIILPGNTESRLQYLKGLLFYALFSLYDNAGRLKDLVDEKDWVIWERAHQRPVPMEILCKYPRIIEKYGV